MKNQKDGIRYPKVSGFAHVLVLLILVAVGIFLGKIYFDAKLTQPILRPSETGYYVGNTEQCTRLEYDCPEGYVGFNDDKGCGCEMSSPAVNEKTPPENLVEICTAHEGKWLSEFNECETITSRRGLVKDVCEELGGIFSDCASPCRNDPAGHDSENVVCPQVCVRVCKF